MRLREVQQRAPPLERHVHAERKLVRWRHADHLRVPREPVDAHPFAVDGDRHHPRAGRREHVAQRRITGLLDGDGRLARRDQDACEQIERLLRACRDHDVSGRACDRTGERHVPGDRLAQGRASLRFGIVDVRRRYGTQRAGGESAPDLERKRSPIRNPDAEVDAAAVALAYRYQRRRRAPCRTQSRIAARRRGPRVRPRRGRQEVDDLRPGAAARADVALAQQPVVGCHHHVARHPERDRQFAGGGQPDSRLQSAADDGGAQLTMQVAAHLPRGARGEIDRKVECRTVWTHKKYQIWLFYETNGLTYRRSCHDGTGDRHANFDSHTRSGTGGRWRLWPSRRHAGRHRPSSGDIDSRTRSRTCDGRNVPCRDRARPAFDRTSALRWSSRSSPSPSRRLVGSMSSCCACSCRREAPVAPPSPRVRCTRPPGAPPISRSAWRRATIGPSLTYRCTQSAHGERPNRPANQERPGWREARARRGVARQSGLHRAQVFLRRSGLRALWRDLRGCPSIT